MKSLSGYVIGRRLRRPRTFVDASLVAYKTSADVVSKLVTLVVTVAAARALAPGDFGVMALAMTSGWILGVASDAGLPMHLATRVAQASAQGDRTAIVPIVRAVMRWRWALGAAAALSGLALGTALVGRHIAVPFTLIVGHQLFGAMLDTLSHAYRGLGRTDIESSLSLAHRGAIALGALTVLALHPSLVWLAVALAVPPLLALIASHLIVRRLTAPPDGAPRAEPVLDGRRFMRDVAPLGAGVLLSALYFRCDVYFIQRLHDVEMVGLYNAAFRIVDALRLFPAAALAVAYPSLCAATDLSPVRRLSLGLLGASVVVATTIFAGADALLSLVYGDTFATAGSALRVLALCLPFFYVNYALTHQLIAWEGQRAYLGIATAALAVNLVANAALIPERGMTGAAAATLITELIVMSGCLVTLRRR